MLVLLLFSVLYASVAASGKAPLVRLNDGREMPSLGLGTWLGFGGKSEDPSKVEKAVGDAIDAGYRLIDTAFIYYTEQQVGRAVNRKINEGVIARDDVFVTTKLWNNRHSEKDVIPALQESLAKLNLSYIDLYLLHWPVATDPLNQVTDIDYLETWKAMIEAKQQGLAKSIGICNFNVKQLERLINETSEKPAVLQIEVNLNLQQPELRVFAQKHDIRVMAYTPFGSLFGARYRMDAPPPRATDPEIQNIAKKYNKTVAQVTLRYLYELGTIPIPKSTTKQRIEENIDIFDFQLSEDDRHLLQGYDKHFRSVVLPFWRQSPYYPFEELL